MKDAILIKGNKYGLSIILNDQLAFTDIEKALYSKLDSSRKFFGSSKVTLSFEGRKLSENEQKTLINVVQAASDLDIVCVVDNDEDTRSKQKNNKNVIDIQEHKMIPKDDISTISDRQIIPESAAIFHKGTLRSGQEVVAQSSVIIMGNVNCGAKVIAKGNVIVIGKLNGYVHAGKDGNNQAFIVALNMNPTQLRIGDIFGRAPDKRSKKLIVIPQIAFVNEEQIVIENINHNIYDNLKFINYK